MCQESGRKDAGEVRKAGEERSRGRIDGRKIGRRIRQHAKYFAIEKKLKRIKGKNSTKESGSQKCKVRGWGEGRGWTILHHTPLPPNAKKKNGNLTIDFTLKHS